MKKIVMSLAAFVMMFLIVAPLTGCSSKNNGVTGTYTASSEGIGTVKVTIRFKDSMIDEVEVDAPEETESIGGRAIPVLIEQLKKANSPNIDGVTGATWTSAAVKAAAEDIFDEADINY